MDDGAFYPPSLLETSTMQFCNFPCSTPATTPTLPAPAHMDCAPKLPPQRGLGTVCVTSPSLGRLCSRYSNELDFGVRLARIRT